MSHSEPFRHPPVDAHTHAPVDRSSVLALRSVRLAQARSVLSSDEGPLCLGLHPWDVKADSWIDDIRALEGHLEDPRIVAIGEAGLDRRQGPELSLQLEAFRAQVDLSERYRLPLIVHCVATSSDLLQVRTETRSTRPWILHGWTGSPTHTEQLLARTDFLLSYGPALLHPGSKARESVAMVPDSRLLLETDESGRDILQIELEAATLRGTTSEALRDGLLRNWGRLFPSRRAAAVQ